MPSFSYWHSISLKHEAKLKQNIKRRRKEKREEEKEKQETWTFCNVNIIHIMWHRQKNPYNLWMFKIWYVKRTDLLNVKLETCL